MKKITRLFVVMMSFVSGFFVGLGITADPRGIDLIYIILEGINDDVVFLFFTRVFPLTILFMMVVLIHRFLGLLGTAAVFCAFVAGIVILKLFIVGLILFIISGI